jgi:hypothetical protein
VNRRPIGGSSGVKRPPDRSSAAVHRWPLSTGFLADKTYTGVEAGSGGEEA